MSTRWGQGQFVIACAKATGVRFGARPKLAADEIAALNAEFAIPTNNRKELARRYGIFCVSVYRICTDGEVSAVPL